MAGYITDAFTHVVASGKGRAPLFWYGITAPDGDASPWASAPPGSIYIWKPDETTQPAFYFKAGMGGTDADWGTLSFTIQRSGSPIGLLLALTHP